jgi:hypothetical protein
MALDALQAALVGLELHRGFANGAHQNLEQIFADSHNETNSLAGAAPNIRIRPLL